MAINLLGNLPTPTTNYSSLTSPNIAYASLAPKTITQPINAQSVTTGLPVAGSITSAPMGVIAKTPTTNMTAPATTLPKAQVSTPVSTPLPVNSPYTYDANGNLVANPNAAPGTAGSADPTASKPTPSTNVNPAAAPANGMNGPYSGTNPASYGGLIQQAANVSSAPSADYLAQQAKANQYNSQLETLREQDAQAQADNAGNPIPLTFQQGRAQVLANQYGQREGALASAYQGAAGLVGAANTQQGQEQSGLLGAASAAAPVTQFGQLTNPINGQVVSPAGGNPQLNAAVAQAIQLVQNGSTPADAMASSGLSNFGVPGTQAFTAAMQQVSNGTYNPTQQSAGAQQNASQATATQGQAFQMDTAIKQLGTIQPLVTNFLQQSGLNSQDNPNFNASLQTYYGQFLSPGNKQIFETYMGDIQKYTSQILAAGSGTIPTDVSNALANFDPRNLAVSQLQPYLDSLAKLGGNQLSVLQGQTSASGGTGYSGTPATVTQTPTVAPTITPSSITSNNPVIQGMVGGALNAFGSATNAVTSFFSHVFGG